MSFSGQQSSSGRFLEQDEVSLANLINESIPLKTRQKANWAHRIFANWCNWRIEKDEDQAFDIIIRKHSKLLDMSPSEMDVVLANFISQVRNKKGDPYPAKTKHEIVTSLQKYLQMNSKNFRLINVDEFPTLYYALDVTMKDSTAHGVGMTVSKANAITKEQENLLWEKGILGIHNGTSLLRTVFYLIGVHFGIRGGQEHRLLTKRNFSFHFDLDGKEYIQYTECQTKTNQGGIKHRKIEKHSARAYASTQPERCPVNVLKRYISLCPSATLEKSFYLKPLQKPSELWFGKQPLGHNTLGCMIKDIMRDAGVCGNYTNHSLRVTTVTRLFEQNVDTELIKQQTGHRSDAVNKYKRISDQQRRAVSLKISGDNTICTDKEGTSTANEPKEHSVDYKFSSDGKTVFHVTGNNNTFNFS